MTNYFNVTLILQAGVKMSWLLWKEEITEQLMNLNAPKELSNRYSVIHPENGKGYFLEAIRKNDLAVNKTLKEELSALKLLLSPTQYQELINYYYSASRFLRSSRKPIRYPLLEAIQARNWDMFHFLIEQGAVLEHNVQHYYSLARDILISNDEQVLSWYFNLNGVDQTTSVLKALNDYMEPEFIKLNLANPPSVCTKPIQDLLEFANARGISLASKSIDILDKALDCCSTPNSPLGIEIIRVLKEKLNLKNVIISQRAINFNLFEVAEAYWSNCKKELKWEPLYCFSVLINPIDIFINGIKPINILINCIKHKIPINWNEVIKNLKSLINVHDSLNVHGYNICEFIFLLEAEKQLDRNILDNYVQKNSQELPRIFLFTWMLNRGNFLVFRDKNKIKITITGIENDSKINTDINVFALTTFNQSYSYFTYNTDIGDNKGSILKIFYRLAPLYRSRDMLVVLLETGQVKSAYAQWPTLFSYFDTFTTFHSERIVEVENNAEHVTQIPIHLNAPCRSLRTIALARLSQSLTKLPRTLPAHILKEITQHRKNLKPLTKWDITAVSNQFTETGFDRCEETGYERLRDKFFNFLEVPDEQNAHNNPQEQALYSTLEELPDKMQELLEALYVPEAPPSEKKPQLFSAQASSSQEGARGQKRKATDVPYLFSAQASSSQEGARERKRKSPDTLPQ